MNCLVICGGFFIFSFFVFGRFKLIFYLIMKKLMLLCIFLMFYFLIVQEYVVDFSYYFFKDVFYNKNIFILKFVIGYEVGEWYIIYDKLV